MANLTSKLGSLSLVNMGFKKELMLAVVVGLLAVAFAGTHNKHSYNQDPDDADHEATSRIVANMKVFVGAVVITFILLYLLNRYTNNANSRSMAGGSQPSPTVVGAAAIESQQLISDAMDAVMKNIDLGDPAF
jgi:hypothetical protein